MLPAEALGAGLVSESLAQYGALCVVRAEYGEEAARRLARHHRDQYLAGRARSDRAERALIHVDEQDHLHYGKGLAAFHALTNVAGFAPVDRALAHVVTEFGGPAGRPLTSLELLSALRRELPPEAEPTLQAWFEEIRFRDARIERAECAATDAGWRLTVECAVRDVRADGDGNETELESSGPIELEVRLEDEADTVLLRSPVQGGRARFEHHFTTRPLHVRVDPRLLHVDRDPSNDEAPVAER